MPTMRVVTGKAWCYAPRLMVSVFNVIFGGSLAAFSLAVITILYLPTSALACSNDTLRSELSSSRLPDCRAYEMVTPPYKEGYSLFPLSYSADGEKAIVGGLANIVGAVGAGESGLEGDLYVDTRANGWQLSPLNAPLSEYVGEIPLASEADHGQTLWEQHTPSQSAFTRDMYVRSATGAFSLIGPIGVPFEGEETGPANNIFTFNLHIDRPVAATSDYSHVILRSLNAEDLWPFDETVSGESVYEYSGLNNSQPRLVGVNGEKGSNQLISRCGTELGSGQTGSAFNALSADGETIFFTAEGEPSCGLSGPITTDEVYARIHGGVASSLAPETVDVSANECSKACGSNASGKNFEGASEDGKVVFFTSTQKLTNDAVDGTTSGNASRGGGCSSTPKGEGGCNLYVYNFSIPGVECQEEHKCLRLVAAGEVLGVAGIAEDGQRIYFVKRSSLGTPELYAYDLATEQTKLVATLSLTGPEEATIWAREFRHPVEVSGEDGRYLLFASATPKLTADDTATAVQLFEYDAVSGELVRVTKGENGYNENGNGVTIGVAPSSIIGVAELLGRFEDFKSDGNRLNISSDGKTIAFRTRGRLSSYATSAEKCGSVYEFHTNGALSEGELHLLSDGADVQPRQGGCGALFNKMDNSGANVLLSTADPLLSSDVDGVQRDVYDARIEGGFPPPRSGLCSTPEICGSPAGSIAPVLPVPASLTQSAESGKPAGTTKPKPQITRRLTQAQRLAKALKACKSKPRVQRASCESSAKRRYRPKTRAKKSARGGAR